MKINKLFFLILLSFFALMMSSSCAHKKNLPNKITKRISDKDLREALFNLEKTDFNNFYSKINIDFKTSKKAQSFSTTVKMVVDSAFAGTFKKGPIVLGTYMVDKDSIKSTNKIDKCYFTENLSFISSIIGVELNYDFFQSVILGKPIDLNTEKKYKQIKDKNKQYYILSSHSKHKFKRIENDKLKNNNENSDDIFMQYYFTPDSLNLAKIHIELPYDTVSVFINYLETDVVDTYKVPKYTTVKIINPKDSVMLQLDYNRIQINEPKELQFSIPDNYENCNK